ncbi:MAG: hypothetical protein LBE13_14065 [Bacteroidales bacterium]|jgi:hypothetical protein|nr:hypothetical protein [Bacteroidales bacterium]
MKQILFIRIFISVIICLFALQGIWLYYAYQSEKLKIEGILNKTLLKSSEKEMDHRFFIIEEMKEKR